jgi:hypothetical protein
MFWWDVNHCIISLSLMSRDLGQPLNITISIYLFYFIGCWTMIKKKSIIWIEINDITYLIYIYIYIYIYWTLWYGLNNKNVPFNNNNNNNKLLMNTFLNNWRTHLLIKVSYGVSFLISMIDDLFIYLLMW